MVRKSKYLKGDIVMGAKDIPDIANYADLHLSPVRKLHVTVEVIDQDNNPIETIQGLATGGSLSVSNDSLVRRTGSLSFVLYDYLLPKKDSVLWMTNKIRVYAGLEDLSSSDNSITHFCLGTFHITEPKVDIAVDSRTISISLEDNMMRWEQEQIESKIEIQAGVPLHTAVIELMNIYGEFNVKADFTDLSVPHLLEFNEGDTVASIITKLRDLYMDWECYYDIDGTFVFRKMDIQRENGEPIAWRFDKEGDLITSFGESFTYKELKNKIVVVGQMNETTGLTPRAEFGITNEDSLFHHSSIGNKTKVIADSSYSTVGQCMSRARYELAKSSTFQEKLSLSSLPIYYLDGNDIIEVRNHATKELEKYVIDSISFSLEVDGEMSIECHKIYYNQFELNDTIEKYRESADIIIDGIVNKGWLSLSEKRVKDYYGLEGDGSDLIVRFEYQGKYGTTAYVTGYLHSSKQTMTIDLADFENSQGDSGDNNTGKAEYSDRVLGHEMVHAIMNNSLGVNKTISLPPWFKEGASELIHGADERLKLSIVRVGKLDSQLVDNLVVIATNLLNGAVWQSHSDYYSAGYVITKYIDSRLQLEGKSMIDLMYSIKQSTKTGDLALRDAIVEHTSFETYQDFVTNFSENATNHIKYNITLNLNGDEVDTGSIAGIDHRGSSNLSAEQVFDNSKATRGVSAVGLNVIFDEM